ncbi:hypothetical protein BCR33DRAFT_712629 [Rhizoclosmatium globosum]|uniref:Uncharacterized protein n=1 Tax=Rhizoclosmatium globosum TaxID=329046 RepID=A0A1Y2CX43_9FUNG|nr:hypothetical protein BCR33DRAFT_712629 [Rhizoclosmatium globosum]|eukprot:ORY51602.1 hypothetical protein BCR33DRAFT_712629 [Rhizoclosmatium globosum]
MDKHRAPRPLPLHLHYIPHPIQSLTPNPDPNASSHADSQVHAVLEWCSNGRVSISKRCWRVPRVRGGFSRVCGDDKGFLGGGWGSAFAVCYKEYGFCVCVCEECWGVGSEEGVGLGSEGVGCGVGLFAFVDYCGECCSEVGS